MSSTGVTTKASIVWISMTLRFTDRALQRLKAIRFGRIGARVAKTPVRGLAGSPLEYDCQTRQSNVEQLFNVRGRDLSNLVECNVFDLSDGFSDKANICGLIAFATMGHGGEIG